MMELYYDMSRLAEDRLASVVGKDKLPYLQECYALETTMLYLSKQIEEILRENPHAPLSTFQALLLIRHPILGKIKDLIGDVDSVQRLRIELNKHSALCRENVMRALEGDERKYSSWVQYCKTRGTYPIHLIY